MDADPEEIETELRSQICLFEKLVGQKPSYIDGHQHIQASSKILPVMVKVMKEQKIDRIRIPIEDNWSKTDWVPQPRSDFYSMLQSEVLLASKGLDLPKWYPFVGYSTMGPGVYFKHLKHIYRNDQK